MNKLIFAFIAFALAFVFASCGLETPQQVSTCRFYGDPDCAGRTADGKFVCSDHREVTILAECWCDPTQGVHWDGRVCVANPIVPVTCGSGTHLGNPADGDQYRCFPDLVVCGAGTHASTNGFCVPDPVAPSCAPGTYAWNGMCYVDPTFGGSCSGSVLRVPKDCTTIQNAMDAASTSSVEQIPATPTTIIVAPGTYRESVAVPDHVNVLLVKDWESDGEVVVDGGMESAFATGMGVWLTLQDITVRSTQPQRYYSDATVFHEFGGVLHLDNVVVYTTSIAVSANYAHGTRVENSLIIGNGGQTKGLMLSHENQVGANNQGARVYNNRFQNLGIGMHRCSGSGATDTGQNGDTNQYLGVSLFGVVSTDC